MKTKICIFALLAAIFLGACSVDDVLEVSDDVNIVKMELVDEVDVLPGDSNGYFSRPVTMVMLIFPIVTDSVNTVGSPIRGVFEVENSSGKKARVEVRFKLINFIHHSRIVILGQRYNPFLDTSTFSTSTRLTAKTALVARTTPDKKHFCLNPGAEATKEFITKNFVNRGKPMFDLNKIQLTETMVMKLKDADFQSWGGFCRPEDILTISIYYNEKIFCLLLLCLTGLSLQLGTQNRSIRFESVTFQQAPGRKRETGEQDCRSFQTARIPEEGEGRSRS